MSVVTDEFPTNSTDDFGYKSLGQPIQLVGNYQEKLPYKQISNLAYAPHTGLFAAAGASEVVIGKLSDLKQDIVDSKEDFTTGKHTIALSGVNSVAFTKDEKYLILSTEATALFAQIDSTSYTSLSTASFKAVNAGVNIEKIIACPSNAVACVLLSEQSELYTLQLPSGTLTSITSDVLDFSFSPKGKQIAIAKKDGTIRQITLDGTEKVTIPRPDDIEDDGLLPLSVFWVSPHTFFASYGQEQEYDQSEDPSFDIKLFVIDHDKSTNTNSFRETYDAVPAFGAVWRKQTVYASTLHNLSETLTSISFFASSTSAEISALTPSDIIQTGDDSSRAALPLNDETGNDINSIGLITDVKLKETVIEPCAGVSEAQWLPTLWVLGHDGKIQGWYVYHVHDLKNGTFTQTGPMAFEDELFSIASGGAPTTAAPASASPVASPFGATQGKAFSFGTSSATNSATPFGAPVTNSTTPFGAPASSTSSPFTSLSSNTYAESKPSFSFGSNTQSSSSAFGNTGFGSTSSTVSTPAFGSAGFGSSATPAFGSNDSKSSAPAAPSFGSTGFGSTTSSATAGFGSSGFGSSGLGSSAFGSTKPAFGSSGFGTSSIGSKPADATSLNSTNSPFTMGSSTTGSTAFSGFSTSASNASPFGALGAEKKGSESSPFSNLVGGKSDTTESPFAAFGKSIENKGNASPFGALGTESKTSGSSPFSSLGGEKKDASGSPFAAFGKSTEKTDNASPFGALSKSEKKTTDSPFGAIGSNDTKAQQCGLFGKPSSNSPFASLNDGKKTDNAFSFGQSAFGAKKEEPEAKKEETNSNTLFGQPKNDTAPAFSFGSKQPASAPLFGQGASQTSGSMNFGSFLSGTNEQTTPLPKSDDDFNSEEESEVVSSDEETSVRKPDLQPQSVSAKAPQGPTSFGTAAGPTSFGSSSSAFGGSAFGNTGFGNTGFKFGEKPTAPTESQPAAPSLNVGGSGFGAFAAKKVEFGSKNIFGSTEQKPDASKSEEEGDNSVVDNTEEAEAFSEDDDDDAPRVGDDELQTDPSDESQSEDDSEDDEHHGSEHDIPEDSFDGFEDSQDQTGINQQYSDEFEDLDGSEGFDDDENEQKEEHDSSEEEEEDVREELADINISDKPEDDEVDEELKASLDKDLHLDTTDSPSESSKSVNEEYLYAEAQKLNPDGSASVEGDEDDVDDLRAITIVSKSTQSGPEYADVQVHAIPEVSTASVDATKPIGSVSIQTETIPHTSINMEAFEDDEAYLGSFHLPKLVPAYVHLGDVRYPPLSNNEVIRELEKIVYDTEAELMIIEENVENMGKVIIDHMNPTVPHTEATLNHSEQWRLGEASVVNGIISSKLGPASSALTQVDSQLKKLQSLKESITAQTKRSTTIVDKVMALEHSSDASVLSARDLPFDTQLLQTKVRATYTRTSNALREAEQRLLTLKTAANVAYDEVPSSDTMHGIIAHINSVTREYANDTKRLSDEIAKLNDNHEKILQGVQNGKSELLKSGLDRGSTLIKVDETQTRLKAQRAVADEFGGRLVMEITSRF